MTLLAISFALPTPVRADCSHPVGRPTIRLEAAPPLADALNRLLDPAKPAPLPPRPCDGPQCSGKSAPVSTTVAPSVDPIVEQAIVGSVTSSPPLATRDPAAEPTLHRSLILAASIWHPPRRSR